MNKKLSAIVLAATTVISGVLAGCSGTQSESSAPTPSTTQPSASTPAGKTTVEFWHSLGGKNGEYISAMIKRFNDTHDNIEVVGTFQGSYDETVTKLQQSIAAKTAPDITMLERAYVQMFAEAEVLEDLTPFMAKTNTSKEDFPEGLMGHSVFNDKIVSLPLNRSTPIMHINKTMLDEKGLAIPTTWEELKKVSEALVVKENGEVKRYGLSMPYDTWYPIAMISQAGGEFFNDDATSIGFEKGEGVKAFQYLKDLQSTGALYYPPAQDSGNIVNQMFTSEKIGIMFQSTGVMGSVKSNAKFDYVTAFLPKDVTFATPTGGANIAMLTDSTKKDAAWEFINWVNTDPQGGQQFILDSGYLPFTKKMVESEPIKELWAKDPNRKVAYDQLQYAVDTNKDVAWPQIMQEFFKAIQAIMYDNKPIEPALDTFKKEAERLLSE